MSSSSPQLIAALLARMEAQGFASEGLARLGKLGIDLGRVAADAHHFGQVLELRVLVPEQHSPASVLCRAGSLVLHMRAGLKDRLW